MEQIYTWDDVKGFAISEMKRIVWYFDLPNDAEDDIISDLKVMFYEHIGAYKEDYTLTTYFKCYFREAIFRYIQKESYMTEYEFRKNRRLRKKPTEELTDDEKAFITTMSHRGASHVNDGRNSWSESVDFHIMSNPEAYVLFLEDVETLKAAYTSLDDERKRDLRRVNCKAKRSAYARLLRLAGMKSVERANNIRKMDEKTMEYVVDLDGDSITLNISAMYVEKDEEIEEL